MNLIADILTPSARDESAYDKSVIAIGHVMLGATAAQWVPYYFAPAWLALMAAYWLAKERGDLLRGGSWRDGMWDTAFVGYGLLYGPWWWPAGAFAFVAIYLLIEWAFTEWEW